MIFMLIRANLAGQFCNTRIYFFAAIKVSGVKTQKRLLFSAACTISRSAIFSLPLATGEIKKTFALKKSWERESDQCSLNFHFSCVNLHVFIVELFNNFAPCKFALLMLGLIRTKRLTMRWWEGARRKEQYAKTWPGTATFVSLRVCVKRLDIARFEAH